MTRPHRLRRLFLAAFVAGMALPTLAFADTTILNVSYTEQNLVKSIILLLALIADSIINPRDEQTAQQEQGDI